MWKWNVKTDLTALCSATLAMTLSLKSIFWLAVSSLKKEEENFKSVDKDRPKEYQIMSSKMKVASQHCDTVPNKTKDIFTL